MYGLSPWNPSPGEWECSSCSAFNDHDSETCWSCGLRVTFSDVEKKPPAASIRRAARMTQG